MKKLLKISEFVKISKRKGVWVEFYCNFTCNIQKKVLR